jgi:hypothetical protein
MSGDISSGRKTADAWFARVRENPVVPAVVRGNSAARIAIVAIRNLPEVFI